jgi:hypothetical protein
MVDTIAGIHVNRTVVVPDRDIEREFTARITQVFGEAGVDIQVINSAIILGKRSFIGIWGR